MTRHLLAFSLIVSAAACADAVMPVEPSPVVVPNVPATVPAPTPVPPVPETAQYEVTFESTWSAATHPTDFPDDAHYSGLIGGTHGNDVTFWREGASATEGIRRMAERGSKSPMDEEVRQAIARGEAEFVLSGGALARSPGTVTLRFDISRTFPRVTLVSMVAPSPDWFVGVSGVSLIADDGWLPELSVPLYPMDAGTDSGVTYRAPDEETRPRALIARLSGYPLTGATGATPFGRMVFRQVSPSASQ